MTGTINTPKADKLLPMRDALERARDAMRPLAHYYELNDQRDGNLEVPVRELGAVLLALRGADEALATDRMTEDKLRTELEPWWARAKAVIASQGDNLTPEQVMAQRDLWIISASEWEYRLNAAEKRVEGLLLRIESLTEALCRDRDAMRPLAHYYELNDQRDGNLEVPVRELGAVLLALRGADKALSQ